MAKRREVTGDRSSIIDCPSWCGGWDACCPKGKKKTRELVRNAPESGDFTAYRMIERPKHCKEMKLYFQGLANSTPLLEHRTFAHPTGTNASDIFFLIVLSSPHLLYPSTPNFCNSKRTCLGDRSSCTFPESLSAFKLLITQPFTKDPVVVTTIPPLFLPSRPPHNF